MAEDAQTDVTEAPASNAPAADTTASALADGGEGSPAEGAGEAPKTGEEVPPPKSALEAAERVMAKAKGDAPTPDKPQPDAAPNQGKTDAKPGDKPEDAKVSFANTPEWKRLSSETRILRVAKEKNEVAIQELTPKAQSFDELSTWLRQANLVQEDFSNGLEIMRLVKNDPQAAYERLRPVMDALEAATGVTLPPDLKQKVDAGLLDKDTAHAYAKERGRAQTLESQNRASQERADRERAEREEREANDAVTRIVEGMTSHVAAWMKRDADAEKMRPLVENAIQAELQRLHGVGNEPKTVEEATKIVDAAIAGVRQSLRSMMPARQPVNGRLPDGAAPPANSRAVPKSSLEAAQMALQGAR